jgi:hypothetical protein
MRDIRVVTQVIEARAETTVEELRRACPPRATRPKRLIVPFGGHNIFYVFISIFVHYVPCMSRRAEWLWHHVMHADPESMSRCDHVRPGSVYTVRCVWYIAWVDYSNSAGRLDIRLEPRLLTSRPRVLRKFCDAEHPL